MKADESFEVCSYDDLLVLWRDGRLRLQCPTCGPLAVPLHETTLSDLTNAAMEHLSERHANSLTLPGPLRPHRADPVALPPESAEPVDLEGHEFWRLIELLGQEGAGGEIEALVRALAGRSEHDIIEFDQWLKAAAARLDTPAHARQRVLDLDRSTSAELREMTVEEFARVRVAVVSAGRHTYAAVLADPTQLTRGWPVSSAQLVLAAPAAAFRRVAGRTLPDQTLPNRTLPDQTLPNQTLPDQTLPAAPTRRRPRSRRSA